MIASSISKILSTFFNVDMELFPALYTVNKIGRNADFLQLKLAARQQHSDWSWIDAMEVFMRDTFAVDIE